MKDEIKEILGEIYNIQVRYSKPMLKKNYSDKDYIIESYENLVFRMKNCITNLQGRCEYLQRSCERKEDEIMSLIDECVELNILKEPKDGK